MWDIIQIIFNSRMCFVILISASFSTSSSEFYDVYYQPDFNTISCIKHHKNHIPSMLDVKIPNTTCGLDLPAAPLDFCDWLPQFIRNVHVKNCSLNPGLLRCLELSNAEIFTARENKWDACLVNDTFAGLCGLKRIYLSEGIIKTIEPLAFRCLHQIELISLDENEIEFLPVDVFKNMAHLKQLDISGNKINTLLQGLFDDLVSLKFLRLSSNSISYLPEDIFCQLSALESLELSQNELNYLNRSLLSNLTKLDYLDLGGNRLERLEDSLSGNLRLLYLNISYNEGVYLNNETIAGLFNLESLEMAKCKLTSLPTGFFSKNPTLSYIDLTHNEISEITPELFRSLRKLQILDLSYNDIAALRNQPFKNNRELKSIYLHKNKLSFIDGSYFKNLPLLDDIDISCNSITNLAYNSFHSLPKLESLNVSHNNIFSWPASQLFRNNTKIRTIDFSYNLLTDISDENWQNLHSITWFWATDNLITDLNISLIPRSLEVHLERNNVHRIYSYSNITLPSQRISSVYLLGNPLYCDCQTYKLYTLLQERSLKHILFDDFICRVPPHLNGRKLDTLKPDEFICNVVDFCPRGCVCFHRAYDTAQVVNCSSSGYVELPYEVPCNTNILDVRQNNLTSLERLNEPAWENLTVLRSEDNSIASAEFWVPRNLKFLGLKDNKLHTLYETVQRHAEDVKDFKVSLSNNPWPCDCSSIHFKKFILEHMAQIVDAIDVRCIFPNGSWSVSTLTKMDDYDLCSSFLGTVAVYSVSALVVVIMSSLVVFYYRHESHILCYLYTQCSRWYLMLCCCFKLDSEEKQFDCFISYSTADADVAYAILEVLECNPPHFTFCIHERNWMPGQFITNNIIQSVQNSRKTIIILSETFTKSEWFRLEFQAAYHQMLRDRRDRLIIVLKGDLPDKSELDKDVQNAITWKTYLRWEDRWFWEKLRRAIWERSAVTKERTRNVHREHCV